MGSRKALAGLLAPPLLWLVVAYLGALFAIFATAFFTTDPFTNEVVPTFTTENFEALLTSDQWPFVIWFRNTLLIATVNAFAALFMGAAAAFAFSRLRFRGRAPARTDTRDRATCRL